MSISLFAALLRLFWTSLKVGQRIGIGVTTYLDEEKTPSD